MLARLLDIVVGFAVGSGFGVYVSHHWPTTVAAADNLLLMALGVAAGWLLGEFTHLRH